MGIYDEYLPELRTATLFCDMSDAEILLVLNAMQPPLSKDDPKPVKDKDGRMTAFRLVVRGKPVAEQVARYFKYDMPKFGEPGMMMAEIPVLSNIKDYVKGNKGKPKGPAGRPKPDVGAIHTLEFTPEMVTRFYGAESAPAQGKMLRNFLGILAQKVCDVRRELFLKRDGEDMYEGLGVPLPGPKAGF